MKIETCRKRIKIGPKIGYNLGYILGLHIYTLQNTLKNTLNSEREHAFFVGTRPERVVTHRHFVAKIVPQFLRDHPLSTSPNFMAMLLAFFKARGSFRHFLRAPAF